MRTDENMLFSKESLNSSIVNVDKEDNKMNETGDDKLVAFINPTHDEDNSEIGIHLQGKLGHEAMHASFANHSNGSIEGVPRVELKLD